MGTALLTALHRLAAGRGVGQLSLSVEHRNPAARLYHAFGYQEVADDGMTVTMVVRLRSLFDDETG